MDKQSEAERLAELLETDGWPDAAAELRRLHAGNERLKQAVEEERDAIIDLVAFYGGPVDLEAAINARRNI